MLLWVGKKNLNNMEQGSLLNSKYTKYLCVLILANILYLHSCF